MKNLPPVSTPVLFYPHADPSEKPVAATVAEIFEDGVANLVIIHTNGDTAARRAAYYIGSDQIHDEKGNVTVGAQRNGAWDYHPWIRPPQSVLGDLDGFEIDDEDEVNQAKPSPRARKTNEEKESYVRKLVSEGLTEDQILGKVKFWGVSRSELKVIIERLGATELVAS